MTTVPALAQAIPSDGDDFEAISVAVVATAEGCPTSDEFFRRVKLRAPGVRLARQDEQGRVFSARFEGLDHDHVTGNLQIRDIEGHVLLREVSGRSCGEVAEALTLIAAVAARSEPASPNDAPTALPTHESTPTTASPTQDVASTSEARRSAWHLFARAEGAIREQILPVGLLGGGGGATVVHEGVSPWQPAIGVAFETTETATASADHVVRDSEMAGHLTMGEILASPWSIRRGPLELRPWATFDIGALSVEGRGPGLEHGRQTQKLWLAAGLLGQVEIRVFGPWRLGAEAGGNLHFTRYNYQFNPNWDVHRVGLIGFVGGLSASFRLQ